MRAGNTFDLVGATPHVRIPMQPGVTCDLYIKLEGQNPSGSIKDRACVAMLRDALDRGELRPGKTILDASSGNMACSLTYYGRILGFPALVVANSKLTLDKRHFIEYFGATLHLVGDFTIEGNHYCRDLAAADPDTYCFLDQLHNPANPRAHYLTTGPEIFSAFPDVAMVVGSLGSGGSLFGTAMYLKEQRPDIKVVAVQSRSGTKLPGTGGFDDGDYVTPFIRQAYAEQVFDHTVKISEQDAISSTLELREYGIFCGLQTGGVYHAALEAAQQLAVTGPVVVLSGDSGWKNMDKLLSIC